MAGPVITALLSPNPASGNITTDGLEDTLASGSSASGTFMLRLDVANMADGDQIELRAYSKANGSDAENQCWYVSLANAQSDKIVFSPPIPTAEDIKFSLKRVAGTDRAYQWSILNLNGA